MSKRSTRSQGSQGHSFSQIASAEIPRSTFDRSRTRKTAFSEGFLIPIMCDEMLPGDTINLRQRSFVRLATPLAPTMDELFVDCQTFFIPLRLIWSDYAAFMGEQKDADDSIDFTVPVMITPGGASTYNSLSDHLGIPINATNLTHSTLFHRAYSLCWNDWYRDPNLQDRIVVDTDAGPDTYGDYVLMRRGRRKDLFTSCLPWPQRGDPITLLFDGIAPVTTTDTSILFEDQSTNESTLEYISSGTKIGQSAVPDTLDPAEPLRFGSVTGLEVDLSSATANTINGLRNAFAVQRLLERDARGGARLKEILRTHFKVISPDARLDRPEYLGGSSMTMGIEQIPASNNGTLVDIGDVGGVGIAQGASSPIVYSATEHGIIMTMCSVRAPLSYQQGLNKKFSRVTRYDYFWPAFSHIGEQPILNKEIYAQGTDDLVADAAVFGYSEAWAQYRYSENEITGVLQSDASVPLDHWHYALDFSSLPVLNDSFIQDNAPVDRTIAAPGSVHFIADFAFDLKHTRPIPVFSTPGLIDHF